MFIGVLVDSSKHPYYGEKCRACEQALRVGRVAMVFEQEIRGRREFILHRDCMEQTASFLVTDTDHEYFGAKCADCTASVRVNQQVVTYDQGRGVYGGRELVVHVRCLEYALETAPLERQSVDA